MSTGSAVIRPVRRTVRMRPRGGPRKRLRPAVVEVARPVWQKRLLQLVTAALLVGGACVAARVAMKLQWSEILEAIQGYTADTILVACGLTACGYAVASCYDLLCRRYEGHAVTTSRALATGFVSMAFAMNLGSLIGGWGMRYRLYSRFGLPARQITRIISLCLITNWAGFFLLAGLLFTMQPPHLPPDWPVHGAHMIRVVGAGLLTGCASYLFMCAHGRGRSWSIRGVQLRRPTLRFAGLQLLLSCLSWIAMGSVLNYYLPAQVSFVQVMAILCVSSLTGLIIRMPAGLGVLEMVFVTMLQGQIGNASIIAALLAFRATYYLLPLTIALAIYGVLEWCAKHRTFQATPLSEHRGLNTEGGIP